MKTEQGAGSGERGVNIAQSDMKLNRVPEEDPQVRLEGRGRR
jgi:hypothetical protein